MRLRRGTGLPMSLKIGKTERALLADALEGDHETLDDAISAVFEAAEEIFRKRAQYVVVGQLVSTVEKGRLEPSDPEAIKVCLDWYSTAGDAEKAAESLWHGKGTGDIFACWVLPMFHGTPAELHAKQKEKYAEIETRAADKRKESLRAGIEKRLTEAQERASGGKGSCVTCRHQPYDHRLEGQGKGRCALTDCVCPKFEERRK